MRAIAGLLARLHLRQLWVRRLRTALALTAVAAGTALALAVLIVLGSIGTSFARFGQMLAGPAPVRVVGAVQSGGLPPSALVAVQATPGVAAAIPLVTASSVVRTAAGHIAGVAVIGIDCADARRIALPVCPGGGAGVGAGSAALGGPLLVGASLQHRLGPGSWLQTDQGVLPTAGSTPMPQLDTIAGGDVVVTTLARAETLFDRGVRFDVIEVVPVPGTKAATLRARIARRVGPAYGVLLAGQPPPEIGLATAAFVPLLALVAVLAAGIATVLVYDVVALSFEERRRQQAVVAAVGAPPWMLAAGPALESAVVGAAGGLAGAGLGALLAGAIVAPLSTFSEELLGVPVAVHVSIGDVLLGLAFGVAIGLAAVLRPLRRAARLDVAAELGARGARADAAPASRRAHALAGLLAAAGGAALAVVGTRHDALAAWQPPMAIAGFLVSAVGSIALVAAVAPLPVAAVGSTWPGRLRGERWAAVRIGVANAARDPGRLGVMSVAVAAAVAVGIVTGGYTDGLSANITSRVAASVQGRGVVVDTAAGTSGANSDARLPASVVDEIASTPGVASVVPNVSVLSGNSAGSLVYVTARSSPVGGPVLVEGSAKPAAFRSGAVMVGVGLARRQHLRPGASVRLDTPEGMATLPVEGIWEDGAVDGDTVTMSPAMLARLFLAPLPAGVTAVPVTGEPAAALAREIRRLPLPPDVTVTAPGPYLHQQVAQATSQLAPFWALERALLVVAFVGVLATLLLVGVQRRRQVGLLGALGMSPGGVFGMVLTEAVCVGLVGAALGVAAGAGELAVMVQVAPMLIGFHDPYRFAWSAVASTVPVAVAVATVAAFVPAWRASRAPVAAVLAEE